MAEVDPSPRAEHSALPVPPLIVIVGPTGSGKSALALDLAAAVSGEIVNFDSLQLYRGFDIGTAKTPVSARRDISHHLFDVLEARSGYLGSGYSAGDYARLARSAIAEVAARGRVPIAVGGSGFYLRALLEGLPELPAGSLALRARLKIREGRRPGSLHRLLTRLEPGAVSRIHSRDVQKTIRALEIRLLTHAGIPAQETAEPLRGYQILQIGLHPDRSELVRRLNARVEAMFDGGLIEEVRGLLEHGATGDEKPFESLGYKQALQYIRGDTTLKQAILSTQIETRQYAKRQMTWFARDPRVHWLRGFGDDPAIVEEAVREACEIVGKLN
jgi:tRNA dimethylallyltransferase